MTNQMDTIFKKYTVAYIDFLGTKEKINTNDVIHLQTIKKIFSETNNLFKKNAKFLKEHPIQTKIFSDNILMYSEGITGLWDIIAYAAIFQIRALYNGLTVRGGVSYGSFYQDDIFVYGKGLSDAVVLEEQIAVFPRIIIDNKIQYIDRKELDCIKDSDGYYYIDFYSYYPNIDVNVKENEICKNLKNIIIDLKSKSKDVKCMQKYDWLINYHNLYCKKMKLGKECFIIE